MGATSMCGCAWRASPISQFNMTIGCALALVGPQTCQPESQRTSSARGSVLLLARSGPLASQQVIAPQSGVSGASPGVPTPSLRGDGAHPRRLPLLRGPGPVAALFVSHAFRRGCISVEFFGLAGIRDRAGARHATATYMFQSGRKDVEDKVVRAAEHVFVSGIAGATKVTRELGWTGFYRRAAESTGNYCPPDACAQGWDQGLPC